MPSNGTSLFHGCPSLVEHPPAGDSSAFPTLTSGLLEAPTGFLARCWDCTGRKHGRVGGGAESAVECPKGVIMVQGFGLYFFMNIVFLGFTVDVSSPELLKMGSRMYLSSM